MANDVMFVSILGTQIMGTLQPFMAYVRKEGPTLATLLYTENSKGRGTRENAERAAKFIEEKRLGVCEVRKVEPGVVVEIAEEAQKKGERVCFNLDGSLNYLIVECVLALEPYKPLYVVSTDERSLLFDTETGIWEVLPAPETLPVSEMLALQNVPYSKCSPINSPLNMLVKQGKVKLPENSLTNVEIAGMEFECVWNLANNHMCAIRDMIRDFEDRLEEERKYGSWAKDRDLCGQLLDKNILALTSSSETEERLGSASQGAIETLDCPDLYDNFKYKKPIPPLREKELALAINEFLKHKTPKSKIGPLKRPEPVEWPALPDDTLVVCAGTNILPTLIAIASHKPKHLLLCHTPNKEPVDTYCGHIRQFAGELGLSSVTFAPISLEGEFLDEKLPAQAAPNAKIAVNISPGTKGQGAMLGRWAVAKGYPVYSLKTGNPGNLALLAGEGPEPPLESVSPLLFLKIVGEKLGPGVRELDELEKEEDWMEPLCEFMLAADREGKAEELMRYERPLTAGGYAIKARKKGKDVVWKLSNGDKTWTFSATDGKWFEKLCAWALKRAGGKKVILNLSQEWQPLNAAKIANKHNGEVKHKLELDVVGIYKSDYVLISCKSDTYKQNKDGLPISQEEADRIINKAAREAKSTASNLGRFAHALLAHRANPRDVDPDACKLVDWRTICQPDKLAEVLNDLRNDKSQTR